MTPFYRALIGILPAWRSLASRDLPLWTFLRRRRLTPARDEALLAEFRCALCDSQAECKARISRGRTRPGSGCPNAALLRR
jgi:hypothetical protein